MNIIKDFIYQDLAMYVYYILYEIVYAKICEHPMAHLHVMITIQGHNPGKTFIPKTYFASMK